MNLGYLLAGEQMFEKCIALNATAVMLKRMQPLPYFDQGENGPLDDPDKLSHLAYTQMGHCQRKQDKIP